MVDDRTRFWGKDFSVDILHVLMGIFVFAWAFLQWPFHTVEKFLHNGLSNFHTVAFFLYSEQFCFWGLSLLYRGVSFIIFVGQLMVCGFDALEAFS